MGRQARPCFCINELKSSDYFCDNPIFFVPLTASKTLSLEKVQIKFGFLLTYSYLCHQIYYV